MASYQAAKTIISKQTQFYSSTDRAGAWPAIGLRIDRRSGINTDGFNLPQQDMTAVYTYDEDMECEQ